MELLSRLVELKAHLRQIQMSVYMEAKFHRLFHTKVLSKISRFTRTDARVCTRAGAVMVQAVELEHHAG